MFTPCQRHQNLIFGVKSSRVGQKGIGIVHCSFDSIDTVVKLVHITQVSVRRVGIMINDCKVISEGDQVDFTSDTKPICLGMELEPFKERFIGPSADPGP